MKVVNVSRARAQLSLLLDQVENGAVVVMTRRGKRIARLVAEPRRGTNAAIALKPVWALGGLDIEPIDELPLERDESRLELIERLKREQRRLPPTAPTPEKLIRADRNRR
jgi:prevent-host-death family protein